MKRGGFLPRRSSLRRRAMKHQRPDTTSGIPQAVRDAVHVRDGGHCVRCGAWLANVPSSIQHRLPRGRRGGSRLSNLLHICGTATTGCHGEVESERAQAYDDGYSLHNGTEGDHPEAVPVLTYLGWRHYMDNSDVLTKSQYLGRAS